MLPSDRSPVHRVVLATRALGPVTPALRGRYTHAELRAVIWKAAAQETDLKRDALIPYNPSADARIKWLLQWCDVLEGSRRSIEDSITACCDFLCQIPAPFTAKHREAGEKHETLTLAQGS